MRPSPLFYKERHRKERTGLEGRTGLFGTTDFTFAEDLTHCICPAGKRLYRGGRHCNLRGFMAVKFRGPKSACMPCQLRAKCLRHPERTETRQVAYFLGRNEQGRDRFTEKMKRKIDSSVGRVLYGMRLAISEPPFAHIRHVMKLDRFTLRTKCKVNIQWNLFSIVHNITKIQRYGTGFA